jgi:hypothetical protein
MALAAVQASSFKVNLTRMRNERSKQGGASIYSKNILAAYILATRIALLIIFMARVRG